MIVRRIAMVLVVAASVAHAGRLCAQDAAAADIATAGVELDGTVLFRVRGVSALPATARARLIEDRIEAAAADPATSLDSPAYPRQRRRPQGSGW